MSACQDPLADARGAYLYLGTGACAPTFARCGAMTDDEMAVRWGKLPNRLKARSTSKFYAAQQSFMDIQAKRQSMLDFGRYCVILAKLS